LFIAIYNWVANKNKKGNKMRGDYNTLSVIQQIRHNKAVSSLEKISINYFDKKNNQELKSLMLKLLNSELLSLRITRKFFVEKILVLSHYLKSNRNIDFNN
jgi:hypothetical protein